jgi:hypothetical protein
MSIETRNRFKLYMTWLQEIHYICSSGFTAFPSLYLLYQEITKPIPMYRNLLPKSVYFLENKVPFTLARGNCDQSVDNLTVRCRNFVI